MNIISLRLAGMAGLLILIAVAPSQAAQAAQSLTIHEVTMAAPDIVTVEVREGPVLRGKIVELPEPAVEKRGSKARLGDGRSGILIGPQRRHLRTFDSGDFIRLERMTIDRAEDYPALSGLRVVAVYRKSVPWSSGRTEGMKPVSAFQHFIYLKLSAPLPRGSHTVRWPRDTLPPTAFSFDDRQTRAIAIRASQLGHAPGDASKVGYLALWLPGAPQNGAVDFRSYGLKRFEVIDAAGRASYTGDIKLRVGPQDIEEFDGIGKPNDLITYTRHDQTTYTANRAGTYVFELDYSGFAPAAAGEYRLRVPDLGVSDSFLIDRDVWLKAARTALGGLYNQRSGMALDGRHGYTRPECFTERSGVSVLQSRMPLALSSEGGGPLKFTAAAAEPWITETHVPEAWGGYQDAGDWDRRIGHVASSYLLLDLFEQLPVSFRKVELGTPASNDVLPDTLYEGINLPNIVDEAIWNIDFYRRMQQADGAVRGGIESASTPLIWEPCWLESQLVFAYAPDPGASYQYAAAAAKLAIVLESINEPGIAATFRDSALRAWRWAEEQVFKPDLGLSESLKLAEFTTEEQAKVLEKLRISFADCRLWAAGTLFRLTGQAEFNDAVRQRFSSGWVDMGFSRADGAWEYASAVLSGADYALQREIKDRIVDTARVWIAHPQLTHISYKNMKHRAAPMFWGEGGAPNQNEISLLIRAHKLSSAKEFLRTMYDGSAHILGANQVGKSFTVALGKRWPFAPLHEDTIAAGTEPPPGITIYGWALQAMTNYSWIWNAPWAALPEFDAERRVDPYRFSMPVYEYLIEHPGVIMSQEFTVQQSIATTAALWLYLAGQVSD